MEAKPERAIVAAVCHRRVADAVELLLVRTTEGKRWTFPKGHVEPGERRPEAAAREALEEAGVAGDVAATPFTHYRYPGTRADEGESVVAAYLLAVPSSVRRRPGSATGSRRGSLQTGPRVSSPKATASRSMRRSTRGSSARRSLPLLLGLERER